MIIKDHPSWLHLIFSLKGTTLTAIWPRVLFVTVVAIVVTVVFELTVATAPAEIAAGEAAGDEPRQTGTHRISHFSPYMLTTAPFALVGFALSIFLGFRNNACYDRFWEGRKLWGRLVNISRSYTRQLSMLVASSDEDASDGGERSAELAGFRRELVYRTIAYVHAFRHHLRDTSSFEEIAPLLPPGEVDSLRRHVNIPAAIMQEMGMRLRSAWRQGWITDYHLTLLESSLTEFTTIQGACERIKSTPIPYRYTVLTHRIVGIYCLFLPFALVADVHYMTPAVALFVSLCFFGLDDIGDEIEQPFGPLPDHLPVSALSRMIEVNLRQLIGEENVPPLLVPVRGVLQ